MYQAFNARPEGAKSSQPRASERSERHPGLGRRVSDTPPEGAKAATGGIFRHNFPPPSPHFPPPSPHFPPPSPAFNAAVPRISTAIPRISTPVIAFAPFGGVSLSPLPNPGCRFASLACPGLGACNPFGVFVERLQSTNHARLWASLPFVVLFERLHALFQRLKSALRRPVVGEQGRPTLPCGRCWPSGWFSGKGA